MNTVGPLYLRGHACMDMEGRLYYTVSSSRARYVSYLSSEFQASSIATGKTLSSSELSKNPVLRPMDQNTG